MRITSEPVPINDPRLTPDLIRIRHGSDQHFYKPPRKSTDPDFEIPAPERHLYAELLGDRWFWVNGCAECNGEPPSWATYIKCEKHDVCCECGAKRSQLKETPYGHPKGFLCKPCDAEIHEREKREALANMGPYYEWDFENLDNLTCPYCKYEHEDWHHYTEAEEDEVKCPRCDNAFLVTAHPSVTFTSMRKEDL